MKKIILIFILMFWAMESTPVSQVVIPIASHGSINPYESLFNAICEVESSGDIFAWNEKENAKGIVQIRPVRLFDYNKRTGKNYTHDDCYDKEISKTIFMYYCQDRDFETIAREWNGSGKMTDSYWRKVKKHLML